MHNDSKGKEKLTPPLGESGAVAVYFLLIFSVLCGFGGLVVDYGNLVRVKAELQRTADAAALASVTGLVPYTSLVPPTPNWSQGQTKAQTMISNAANQADNATPDDTIAYGYWLLAPPADYVQPPLPKARPTTAAYLPEPAIQVTLSRDVSLYFAPLIGVSSPKTVSATAMAILPEVESIAAGNTFAMAVEESIVYNLDHNVNLTPQDFGYGDHGQWFNLDGSTNVPTIRRNDQINAQIKIYIAPGSKNTLYDPSIIGQTIFVPVVNSVETKTWQTILGFAAFLVTGVSGSSIDGNFLDHYIDPHALPGTGLGGTYYGFSSTPKLVSP